ncbi:MAG: DUF389 domain-containing protein [Porticoccus sp.]|nr:DUF389 domain-containing protein [Porticoccus sp.]
MNSLIGSWRHLVEEPSLVGDVKKAVEKGSVPSFGFFFMLAASGVIATFGLLSNSAAVIIGAMIVAPLMNPIISLAFGGIETNRLLISRSLLTIVIGSIVVITMAFLVSELIGWKLAGSELIARMSPSLLDLGIAVAAGAAAAFAYTRPGVSSALAGIAIAVALVPPLCTVGIAFSLGQKSGTDIGFAMGTVSARGPFLLYLTNIFGIVLSASLIFFLQYFRRHVSAFVALVLIGSCLLLVIPPLGISMDNLLVRNLVHRSLTITTQELVLADRDVRFSNLSIRLKQGMAFVRADLVAAPGVLSQPVVDSIRDNISKLIDMPVVLEFSIIPETIVRSGNVVTTAE